MSAMDHFHDVSCLRFKEWTGEQDYVRVFFNQDSGSCWSAVGRAGGGIQSLSLGLRCWYLGITLHELGHAAGLLHEMGRPDRDTWAHIYWENITPGLESAFAIRSDRRVNLLGDQFDYKSIMMYGEYAFSKDGVSPTVRAKASGVVVGPIWSKKQLSPADVRRLRGMYRCDGNRARPGFPYDVMCSFNKHLCGLESSSGAAWDWRNANSTGGYLLFSHKKAGSRPGFLVSTNMHPVGKPSPKGHLGCVRFWYLLQSDGRAFLKLTQAYLRKVTQLRYDPNTSYLLWESTSTTEEWTHVQLPLHVTKPFKLIFTAKFDGANDHGTIALDDMELLYGPCRFSAAPGGGRRPNPAAFGTSPPSVAARVAGNSL
ncbi:meprin A subunit beta-like [Bacillus rossius redtenbacheri]|uniref:meprin A subunit beta-like n=1 Tax=Bacillus rossius redtenbacheri TaxID=93214 RepID=UPI002FDE8D31